MSQRDSGYERKERDLYESPSSVNPQFYYDRSSNVILYPGVAAPALQQFNMDLKQLNGQAFATVRTLRNLQILRHHNYPVPPIMDEENYDWPIERGRKPLPHQKIYANFTVLHPKMFNLGDPGTMKTLSTLWAADYLMRIAEARGDKMRALIVAPLSILDSVWGAAIFRNFMNRRTFRILSGDENKRSKLLAEEADFYIINPDGIKVGAHTKRGDIRVEGFAQELQARTDIQIVIVDEATALKDHTSGRSRVFKRQFKDRQYLWMLTGTPINNSPTDAYGMALLVNNAHGKSFNGFRMETMFKVTNFIWTPRKDGYERARRILTPAVRFALTEVWDAPEMTFQRRQIELTADQKKAMADLKRDLIVVTKSGKPIDAANEAAARWKYLQIAMGAIYDSEHNAHLVDAIPRYKEAIDIIESTERKVVIGVPITSVIHLLKKRLDEHWKKTDFKCDFINGEVTGKDRTKKIQEFASDPNFRVMIVDPQAAGHGINEFVVADTLIYFSAIDKTELFLQLNARLRRPGQQYPMTCFQLYATKLESEMFDRLETNTSMQGLLLQAIREGKF